MEEKKKNEIRNYPIKKSNELIQKVAFGLNAQEFDLLNYIIMKIKDDDKDLKPIQFAIREYCSVADIDLDGNYETIKKSLKGLADKSVWIDDIDENGRKIKGKSYRWIEDPEINYGSGIITVNIKSYWKEFLIELKKRYTVLTLYETLPMRSVYGKRLYEMMKSYLMNRPGPVDWEMDISELKEKLLGKDEAKKKYKEFSNFKKKVIVPATKDLEEYGDVAVKTKLIKEGRSYKYIRFTISRKDMDRRFINEDHYFGDHR